MPKTRKALQLPLPALSELRREELGSDAGYNLETMLLHFLRQGRLRNVDAMGICTAASTILREEENVVEFNGPVTVVGDINGQFYDLAKILALHGSLQTRKILFLGNYIGAGGFNCECLLLLFAAKLTYPQNVILLRGNHESRFGASLSNLEPECIQKYSAQLFDAVIDAFNCLPLAATVSKRYFCVHGGLSRDIARISDMQFLHRFREIPAKGAMCDLLWSDPYWDADNPTSVASSGPSKSPYFTPGNGTYETQPTFFFNEQRGCGLLFNFAAVRLFNSVNKLICVIRSHECQDDGYKLYRTDSNSYFPCVISVFSTPNYCGTFENKGAIMKLTDDTVEFQQFYCSPHPYILPNLNAFSWSLPFLVENVDGLLKQILAVDDDGADISG